MVIEVFGSFIIFLFCLPCKIAGIIEPANYFRMVL